ncbi:MAG: Serine hydroxymethyltransferase [Candidatus Gottesmanbacteria bacterium GW2011_GWA2_44_17]|uniref:Serine hydroxymethyltransferase n=1 Tax=Candidatus Gottesmanbacteria bacterium GW2011_GWA2_44_17 TaxID=1618444 RepID=A0A0G1HIY4_9BACT|nr:MAG: Serine hydroxymethyltransferase [Candidatus Gottesmanbacteria bacterium GW2011_GWA2_44_17]
MNNLRNTDPTVNNLIKLEAKRQEYGLEMIPSENYVSPGVRRALGSILTNKYSEGYPGRRYYGGNEFIDQIETIAIERAKKLFKVPFVNVQPYSGSPANLAVYLACLSPGDPFMGLNLPDGGHLTHGWKVSATAQYYRSIPYHVREDGRVDFDEVWKLAKNEKPKLIWAGATAYVYEYEFDKFADIAESVGAYFAADIAHVAGLVVAGVHKSPVPYAHIVTTTTHKTLRGPRGAMIMTTKKGIEKDPNLASKIDKAVFPGLQGGPHNHQTAAIAVSLKEAMTPAFARYGKQIVKNAKALAAILLLNDISLIGNGTENHLLLLNLVPLFGPGGGVIVQDALSAAGITVNKNTIPKDPSNPFYPSGIRLGTPALTTRGMKEKEMKKVGAWITRVIKEASSIRLPESKEERPVFLKKMREDFAKNSALRKIKEEVKRFCASYPLD